MIIEIAKANIKKIKSILILVLYIVRKNIFDLKTY